MKDKLSSKTSCVRRTTLERALELFVWSREIFFHWKPDKFTANLWAQVRMVWEGTFQDHVVQPPCHGQWHLSLDWVFKVPCSLTLNTSNNGPSTTCLEQPSEMSSSLHYCLMLFLHSILISIWKSSVACKTSQAARPTCLPQSLPL